MSSEILEAVTRFADNAHGEQLRKFTGERYIVHPLRVMETCREYTSNNAVLAAVLLHDVIEDTPVREEEIRAFMRKLVGIEQTEKTVALVVELTDVYTKKAFPRMSRAQRKKREFERLSKCSNDAQTIKYADLMDNCLDIFNNDRDFRHVFLREARLLLDHMTSGHPGLYDKVCELVDSLLQKLEKGR